MSTEQSAVINQTLQVPVTTDARDTIPATNEDSDIGILRKLYAYAWFRKTLVLIIIAVAWQVYARNLGNELVFPTFGATLSAMWEQTVSGALPRSIGFTIRVLLIGYSMGILLAMAMTRLAVGSKLGNDLLEMLTSMFNPLPPIALLPLSLLWFGLGNGSLLFVLTHSVLWPVAISTHAGFRAVSPTLRMVGRNYGLSGWRYIVYILIPAAFPSILAGLKNGWAFAWRTLIAAELVFGVSSGSGGLGWYLYANKNQLEIPAVFAGLLALILIGLVIENLIFRQIEKRTVKRWGMHV
jgi:NitT/TauT family transport system permease protein